MNFFWTLLLIIALLYHLPHFMCSEKEGRPTEEEDDTTTALKPKIPQDNIQVGRLTEKDSKSTFVEFFNRDEYTDEGPSHLEYSPRVADPEVVSLKSSPLQRKGTESEPDTSLDLASITDKTSSGFNTSGESTTSLEKAPKAETLSLTTMDSTSLVQHPGSYFMRRSSKTVKAPTWPSLEGSTKSSDISGVKSSLIIEPEPSSSENPLKQPTRNLSTHFDISATEEGRLLSSRPDSSTPESTNQRLYLASYELPSYSRKTSSGKSQSKKFLFHRLSTDLVPDADSFGCSTPSTLDTQMVHPDKIKRSPSTKKSSSKSHSPSIESSSSHFNDKDEHTPREVRTTSLTESLVSGSIHVPKDSSPYSVSRSIDSRDTTVLETSSSKDLSDIGGSDGTSSASASSESTPISSRRGSLAETDMKEASLDISSSPKKPISRKAHKSHLLRRRELNILEKATCPPKFQYVYDSQTMYLAKQNLRSFISTYSQNFLYKEIILWLISKRDVELLDLLIQYLPDLGNAYHVRERLWLYLLMKPDTSNKDPYGAIIITPDIHSLMKAKSLGMFPSDNIMIKSIREILLDIGNLDDQVYQNAFINTFLICCKLGIPIPVQTQQECQTLIRKILGLLSPPTIDLCERSVLPVSHIKGTDQQADLFWTLYSFYLKNCKKNFMTIDDVWWSYFDKYIDASGLIPPFLLQYVMDHMSLFPLLLSRKLKNSSMTTLRLRILEIYRKDQSKQVVVNKICFEALIDHSLELADVLSCFNIERKNVMQLYLQYVYTFSGQPFIESVLSSLFDPRQTGINPLEVQEYPVCFDLKDGTTYSTLYLFISHVYTNHAMGYFCDLMVQCRASHPFANTFLLMAQEWMTGHGIEFLAFFKGTFDICERNIWVLKDELGHGLKVHDHVGMRTGPRLDTDGNVIYDQFNMPTYEPNPMEGLCVLLSNTVPNNQLDRSTLTWSFVETEAMPKAWFKKLQEALERVDNMGDFLCAFLLVNLKPRQGLDEQDRDYTNLVIYLIRALENADAHQGVVFKSEGTQAPRSPSPWYVYLLFLIACVYIPSISDSSSSTKSTLSPFIDVSLLRLLDTWQGSAVIYDKDTQIELKKITKHIMSLNIRPRHITLTVPKDFSQIKKNVLKGWDGWLKNPIFLIEVISASFKRTNKRVHLNKRKPETRSRNQGKNLIKGSSKSSNLSGFSDGSMSPRSRSSTSVKPLQSLAHSRSLSPSPRPSKSHTGLKHSMSDYPSSKDSEYSRIDSSLYPRGSFDSSTRDYEAEHKSEGYNSDNEEIGPLSSSKIPYTTDGTVESFRTMERHESPSPKFIELSERDTKRTHSDYSPKTPKTKHTFGSLFRKKSARSPSRSSPSPSSSVQSPGSLHPEPLSPSSSKSLLRGFWRKLSPRKKISVEDDFVGLPEKSILKKTENKPERSNPLPSDDGQRESRVDEDEEVHMDDHDTSLLKGRPAVRFQHGEHERQLFSSDDAPKKTTQGGFGYFAIGESDKKSGMESFEMGGTNGIAFSQYQRFIRAYQYFARMDDKLMHKHHRQKKSTHSSQDLSESKKERSVFDSFLSLIKSEPHPEKVAVKEDMDAPKLYLLEFINKFSKQSHAVLLQQLYPHKSIHPQNILKEFYFLILYHCMNYSRQAIRDLSHIENGKMLPTIEQYTNLFRIVCLKLNYIYEQLSGQSTSSLIDPHSWEGCSFKSLPSSSSPLGAKSLLPEKDLRQVVMQAPFLDSEKRLLTVGSKVSILKELASHEGVPNIYGDMITGFFSKALSLLS